MKIIIMTLTVVAAFWAWLAVSGPASAQVPGWQLTSAPTNTWTSVATSADGARLVAAGGHSIYTSTNYGSTWVSNNALATVSWASVASSADGTKLVSASGAIYTNAGTTWTLAFNNSSQDISSIASSADGTKFVAASGFALLVPFDVFVSANSGASWAIATNTPGQGPPWASVASSADGTKLLAGAGGGVFGCIFASANGGSTWLSNSVPPVTSLACSADGNEVFASTLIGLFNSTNAGGTWAPLFSAPIITNKIACSTNGLVLFGLAKTNIYSSFNGGTTWSTNTAPASNWTAIAVSKDGTRAVAAVSGGGVYILNPPPLLLTTSNNTVSLLWSTNYTPAALGLAQNTNLATANWIAVPNVPVVKSNFYQVSLPATNQELFFRLQTP